MRRLLFLFLLLLLLLPLLLLLLLLLPAWLFKEVAGAVAVAIPPHQALEPIQALQARQEA